MHFRGFDLNHLVALDSLLQEQSVSRAASRLHVTQSTMSGILSRLRKQFEDELLVQVGRRMVPTTMGAALVRPLRDVILQIQATIDTSVGFDPSTATRHFKMIASDYVSGVLLAAPLRAVKAQAPGVTFEILSNTGKARMAVKSGDVDLAFLPRDLIRDEHPSEVVYEDTYSCVVWSGNQAVGRKISRKQYLQADHVICRLGDGSTPAFDEMALEAQGAERHVDVVVASFNLLPSFVMGTSRVATMPTQLAKVYEQSHSLRMLPMPIRIPGLAEAMQWHKARQEDAGLTWLRTLIRTELGRAAGSRERLGRAPG